MPKRIFCSLLLILSILPGIAMAQEDTFTLLGLGREAAKAGKLDEAQRYHQRAVEAAELSGDPVQLGEAIGDLGGIFLARWRMAEARELCLKALALLRANPNKRFLPVVLNNLGVISMNRGEYVQSEEFFEESLQAVRALPRPDPYESRVLNNLGALYYTLKDLGKAEKNIKKAISVTEKLLGTDSVELAPFLSNLGAINVLRKKWVDAANLLGRALLLLEPHPESISLAGVWDNLGMMHHLRRNFAESEKVLRKAYELRLQLFGPENQVVLVTQVKLAGTLRELGRYEEAEQLLAGALAGFEKTARLRTVDAAKAMEELAILLRRTSRGDTAEPLESKAKAIRFDLTHTVPTALLP